MAGICGDCTKCCEAIHVDPSLGRDIIAGSTDVPDGPFLQAIWEPISEAQAQSINPYMFSCEPSRFTQEFIKTAMFFRCTRLKEGVGCTIHEGRPQICRNYMGDDSYVSNCRAALIASDAI